METINQFWESRVSRPIYFLWGSLLPVAGILAISYLAVFHGPEAAHKAGATVNRWLQVAMVYAVANQALTVALRSAVSTVEGTVLEWAEKPLVYLGAFLAVKLFLLLAPLVATCRKIT